MSESETRPSLFDLSEKVAIITGSSRGIGHAIAMRMAEHGACVVISSRDQQACDTVADDLNGRFGPGRAVAVAASIGEKADLRRLVDRTMETFGRIDILVCNAASNPHAGPMSSLSDEQFEKILRNNVLANHWLAQMVAPQMLERKDGAILVISSIGGLRGSDLIGAYNLSKAADMQLVRNLAVEWGPANVRVNCIAPGLIQTEFARALWEDEAMLKRVTRPCPLKRIGQPDEIAGAAVFLCSQAGSYVAGQTLVIDGGLTIAG